LVTVGEIAGFIEKLAPLALAESWDKVGLQVGRATAGVGAAIVCLDVTGAILDEALAQGCELVISHHPLIFNDFTGLSDTSATGRLALKAAEKGLAVYVAHTNLDKAAGGISDALAARLGLTDVEALEAGDALFKLVVFVPKLAVDEVKAAIGDAGGGRIGLYSHCAFSSAGVGTFRPLPGANPSEGEVGRENQVEEYRLEVEVGRTEIDAVVEAMRNAHPYEEVAYDLYELRKYDQRRGLGRVGNIKPGVAFDDFIALCVRIFGGHIRYAGSPGSENGKWKMENGSSVGRVAVCGGSGGSLVTAAKRAGADCLLTGDIKYHEAQKALDMGLAVIDAGHDGTEIIGMQELGKRLEREFNVKVLWPEAISSIWQGV